MVKHLTTLFQEFNSSQNGTYRRNAINPNSLTPTNWTPWEKMDKVLNLPKL